MKQINTIQELAKLAKTFTCEQKFNCEVLKAFRDGLITLEVMTEYLQLTQADGLDFFEETVLD